MHLRLCLLASPLLLAACAGNNNPPLVAPVGDGRVAETVNGTPVPQALIEAFAKARGVDLNQPDQRAHVLRVFADYVLLAQQAERDGLLKKPEFAADIENARLSAVSNATIKVLQQETPIPDDALKAEYEAGPGKAGRVELDFSQLLFATEDDALKAAGDITSGKPFAKVYDAWKDKAKQAKVFTHVRADQLPEPLAQALAQLRPGDATRLPVKTQFGFHVVHLDASNPFTPPPFEQVRDTLRRQLAVKAGQQRLDRLRDQAKIEYPPGSAPVVPAAPTVPPGGGAAPAKPGS